MLEIPWDSSALGCSQAGCWKMVQVLAGSLLFWEIQTHLLHWIWIPFNLLAYSISSWEYLCHMCSFSSAIQKELKKKKMQIELHKVASTHSRAETVTLIIRYLRWRIKPWILCQISRQTSDTSYSKVNSTVPSDLKTKRIFFYLC